MDPNRSSAEELEAQDLTHLPAPPPVRSSAGRGEKDGEHNGSPESSEERLIPDIHLHCCIMGSKGDASTRCTVVAKGHSRVLPRLGACSSLVVVPAT